MKVVFVGWCNSGDLCQMNDDGPDEEVTNQPLGYGCLMKQAGQQQRGTKSGRCLPEQGWMAVLPLVTSAKGSLNESVQETNIGMRPYGKK